MIHLLYSKKKKMISFIRFYIIFIILVYITVYFLLFYHHYSFNKKKCFNIVLTGSVGGGKTTFAKYLKKFLEKKGFKVYICEELAIQYEDALAHYYSGIKEGSISKYAFWFQSYLLNKYEMFYKYELPKLQEEYRVIIHDRSFEDTRFFTKLNITDQKDLEFLDEECKKIEIYFDLVIYLDPGFEKSIEYKEKRDRDVEKDVNHDYLHDLYSIYEKNINSIYPGKIDFDSSVELNEYSNILERMYKLGLFNNII